MVIKRSDHSIPSGGTAVDPQTTGKNLPAMLPKALSLTKVSTPMAPMHSMVLGISRGTPKKPTLQMLASHHTLTEQKGENNHLKLIQLIQMKEMANSLAMARMETRQKMISATMHTKGLGAIFSNYAETSHGANDTFTSYGSDSYMPRNEFKAYGDGGDAPVETFKNYREGSTLGEDSFQSYGKNSNGPEVNFVNYNQSSSHGNDDFTSYGENAKGPKVGFKIYGFHFDNIFKRYAKNGNTSFAKYSNFSTNSNIGRSTQWVEPGKFFRENMLKKGVVMPMPNIRDKMPKRSFLPRSIAVKMPFSTTEISQLKKVFHAEGNSTMTSILTDALNECTRAPSPGETKQCVSSVEDMIDFATSVLGRNVAVKTTENTKGSDGNIMIGSVKGINGGKVTESVSCHQSLFPYLMYYCHSVPKVRVYEADILDPQSKVKINHGVAICHLDTSAWSATHGAFIALGSGPGKIEICHWIFENDMTWTVAD